jgi:hypothetical protein
MTYFQVLNLSPDEMRQALLVFAAIAPGIILGTVLAYGACVFVSEKIRSKIRQGKRM